MSSETLYKDLSPLMHHASHLPSQNPVGLAFVLLMSCFLTVEEALFKSFISNSTTSQKKPSVNRANQTKR